VHYHGAAFSDVPFAAQDYVCQRLCVETRCLVFSVDYRAGPQSPFPQAINDAWEALAYVAGHAEEWGGDSAQLGVVGNGFGGNLATGVAVMCRDSQTDLIPGPKLSLQVLLDPVLDWSLSLPSYNECGLTTTALTAATQESMCGLYLPNIADQEDPRATPARITSLEGVAPAIVVCAELSPLRSEGETFAERLRMAGSLISANTYRGVMHDFFLHFQYEKSPMLWKQLGEQIIEKMSSISL